MTNSDATPLPSSARRLPLLVDVVALERAHRPQAAAVLAAAFIDDPAWLAIGPTRRRARQRLLSDYYDILVGEALRFAGPSWCAINDGRVVGVALVYADGRRFPPPLSDLREAPPFLRAGPGPGLRGLRVDIVMKRAHPEYDHLLLWYIAAHPAVQRRGVGSTLLGHVKTQAAHLRLPIYLDTTKRENIDWYTLHGFHLTGDAALPRGARVWFLRHEAPRS